MQQVEHINKTRLEELRVEAVSGTKKFIRLKDKRVKSFFWQATQKGLVTGVIRYNFNGSDKVFAVAEFGSKLNQFTVSGVIAKAMKAATEIKNGGDPQSKHKKDKSERSLINAVRASKKHDNSIYVEAKANEYYAQHKGLPNTKKIVRAALDDITAVLGHKQINDVTREDVVNLLITLQDRGADGKFAVAENCQKYGRAMWNWGLDRGGFECINHFAALKSFRKEYRTAARKGADEKSMTMADVKEMAEVHYRNFPKGIRRTIILQAYTVVRPSSATSISSMNIGEPVLAIDWSEFDVDKGTWHLSKIRMKGREQSHEIDMPSQLVAHVKAWHKADGYPTEGLVVSMSQSPFGPMTPNNLSAAYLDKKLGYTPHKWRHLISNYIAERGGPEIAELILGHYTTRIYHNANRKADRAKWLQTWADELDTLGFDKLVPSLIQ